MNYRKELEIAKKAAKHATAIIQQFQNSKSFDIKLKGKNDLVTDADLASEREILRIIGSEFPEDDFLAEETRDKQQLPEGRVWIIDPIDGTTNFTHGFPIYCISIALWIDGVPKVGLVKEAANGELFWAVEGEGAYLNEQAIQISSVTDPAKALIGTGFPYTAFEYVDEYLNLLKSLMKNTHGIRRPGAASYDFCCVAAGRFDGFFEYGLSAWDVAAGALIIKEAGGIVKDWKGGNDWLFEKQITAGNKAIVNFLNKEIEKYFG